MELDIFQKLLSMYSWKFNTLDWYNQQKYLIDPSAPFY